MRVTWLGAEDNGTRSIEVRTNQISYRSLLRLIRKIPEANVKSAAYGLLNDEARIVVEYKGAIILIETPFSDYIVSCLSHDCVFEDFVAVLAEYKVKWWERFI